MVLDFQLDPSRPAPAGRAGFASKGGGGKCFGISERVEVAAMQRQQSVDGDPWLVRKLAVGIVLAVLVWSYYVFVGRVCVPMIRGDSSRLGGIAQGVVYLVLGNVLFCMFVWSYSVAITTPPGFARDYVPQTDPPKEQVELITVAGQRFEDQPASPRQAHTRTSDATTFPRTSGEVLDPATSPITAEGSAQEHQASGRPASTHTARSSDHPDAPLSLAGGHVPSASASGTTFKSSIPTSFPSFPSKAHLVDEESASGLPAPAKVSVESYRHFPPPPEDYEPAGPKLLVDRVPPRVPLLTEDYRYDVKEGLLRPYRSHRCRHCAAVVLKQDHHCPWVGSCVGARNYKYFYNFLQWSTAYTLFVFLALILAITRPPYPRPTLDGEQIAVIAVSGFFSLFTSTLLGAHTRLIMLNMTTIEELTMARMRGRERAALSRVYGFMQEKAKRKTKQRWNEEWGRLGREGNLWWLGSRRANWVSVMGERKLGWFLPVPASPNPDDGLSYVPNPRFSKEGFWRPRSEWPEELR